MSQQRMSFKVHGTVQGVNFRQFSKRTASSLGVTGWVRNTSDGAVEGEAQATPDNLNSYLKELDKGPRAAHVVKLEKKHMDVQSGESSFEVR